MASAKIKVWHGIRTAGVVPKTAGAANAPVLEAPSENDIHAFAGRYAIIKPLVKSGDVKGYYVSIKGATDYFKVDYAKPLITERHSAQTNSTLTTTHGFNFKVQGVKGGSCADSAIVLILPPDFHVPDTFCVTYSAYDQLGNISDSVSSCIIVSKLGGDASTNWLQAGWRVFYDYDDMMGNGSLSNFYDTIPYNKWIGSGNATFDKYSSNDSTYYCNTISPGLTQFSTTFINFDVSRVISDSGASDYYAKLDILFNINGGIAINNSYKEMRIDSIASSCDETKYRITAYDINQTGGWTITGDKMILIIEFNANGTPLYDVWEYTLKRINDTEIWLIDNSEPGHGIYTDFRKL